MPSYLLRMRNLRPALWCVSELRVARWGSALVEVRGKLEAVSVLPYTARDVLCLCHERVSCRREGIQLAKHVA